MSKINVSLFFLFTFFICTLAWGNGRQGQENGFEGRNQMAGRSQSRGARGFQGDQGHFDEPMGRNGRQQYGGQDDSKKYRSNLYSDDDVYGYDATYPNGEAVYINYKSKDARARRGPEFARTSRAYSRQSGQGNGGSHMQEYGGKMF